MMKPTDLKTGFIAILIAFLFLAACGDGVKQKEMREKRNISVILAEHNDAAFQMTDNVVVMKEGNVSHKFGREEFLQKDFLNNHLYN